MGEGQLREIVERIEASTGFPDLGRIGPEFGQPSLRPHSGSGTGATRGGCGWRGWGAG